MFDNKVFITQKDKVLNEFNNQNNYSGIGKLNEKILHKIIKFSINPNEENHEIKIGKYYADVLKNNTIYEIQTRAFNKLRPKLDFFLSLKDYTTYIILPIPYVKYIYWIDNDTKKTISKRKSPKLGSIYDSILEIYKIKQYLNRENLKFVFLFINLEEYRNLNGWDKTKKKGSTRYERIPLELVSYIEINNINDYRIFIPKGLNEQFTNKDFQKAAKTNLRVASTCTNILVSLNLIELVGKKGKMNLYKVK